MDTLHLFTTGRCPTCLSQRLKLSLHQGDICTNLEIQIGQWHRRHPNAANDAEVRAVKPRFRAAVKFRDLEKSVLNALQLGDGNDETLASDGEDDGDSDTDEEAESDAESLTVSGTVSVAFEVDPDINIDSQGLRDLVSVDQTVREGQLHRHATVNKPPATETAPDWNW